MISWDLQAKSEHAVPLDDDPGSGEAEALRRLSMASKGLKLIDDLAPASIKPAASATAPGATPAERSAADLRVLVPAFRMSEIRCGFEIGFLIALPLPMIDMVVSTITMSTGMMMLSPCVVSLPLKVLFFVLIDGWNLLVGSSIWSYS